MLNNRLDKEMLLKILSRAAISDLLYPDALELQFPGLPKQHPN